MKTNAIEWLNNNICPFNSDEQLKDGIYFYNILLFQNIYSLLKIKEFI